MMLMAGSQATNQTQEIITHVCIFHIKFMNGYEEMWYEWGKVYLYNDMWPDKIMWVNFFQNHISDLGYLNGTSKLKK